MKSNLALNLSLMATALALVVVYLARQKKKDDRYFGKQTKLTKREEATLHSYRQQYQPVMKNGRLPVLKRDGYTLEDVAYSATQYIFDQPLPTTAQKAALKAGDMVKLKFEIEEDVERMWVEIAEVEAPLYRGVLRNDSIGDEELKDGREVWFHGNHIFEIDKSV